MSSLLSTAKERNIIWEEFKNQDKVRPLCFDGTNFTGLTSEYYLLLCECDEDDCLDYNWIYRVWNNMPTTLERKVTHWKEDPYA